MGQELISFFPSKAPYFKDTSQQEKFIIDVITPHLQPRSSQENLQSVLSNLGFPVTHSDLTMLQSLLSRRSGKIVDAPNVIPIEHSRSFSNSFLEAMIAYSIVKFIPQEFTFEQFQRAVQNIGLPLDKDNEGALLAAVLRSNAFIQERKKFVSVSEKSVSPSSSFMTLVMSLRKRLSKFTQ